VHHVGVSAEQKTVNGHALLAVGDGKILGNSDHGRGDHVVEGIAGARTAVCIGNTSTQELAGKKLVPMEVAFPVVTLGATRTICPRSVPLVVKNEKKPSSTAAAFAITTIIGSGAPGWTPVGFRIFVEIRRKEKRIFAYVTRRISAIFEHGKTHVH